MSEIRKSLGICPQHDILFKELTVLEHLELFCRFKGVDNQQEIQQQTEELIEAIDLTEKRDTFAKNLSGGQKRKLSLAIALIGGSSVIMLDEPTSGMDLTARRRVWDMLRNYKRNRIIILTTHYMEEAEILADRIAILSEGQLYCLGSALFLKSRFNVGYNLKIIQKKGISHEQNKLLDEVVTRTVEGVTKLSQASSELSYSIPMEESKKFQRMFEELDARTYELGIETYGISVTNLEAVFLKIARGEDEPDEYSCRSASIAKHFEEDKETLPYEPERQTQDFNISEDRKTGVCYIFFTHFYALLEKRAIHSVRDYKGFCLEILLPLVLVL